MRKTIIFLILVSLPLLGYAAPTPKAKPVLEPFSLALASPFAPPSPAYITDNYMEMGGSRWVIGGSLDVVSGGELDIEPGGALKIAGTDITTSLTAGGGVTAGAVTASKMVIVDANKDIGDFRNLDAVNFDAGADAVAGTVDIFPTTTASGKLALTCADNAGAFTVTLVNASHGQATTYTIPDAGVAAANIVASTNALTLAEVDVLDAVTAGTVAASKAVVVDSNKDVSAFRNVTGVNFDAGASGTAGTVDIFPTSATSGKIAITAADNADDYTITLVNASHGQATTYTIPDIGQATGNIVTLKASQSVAGELTRADLTEDALAIYGITLYDIRAADLAPLGDSETAGDHFYDLSSEVVILRGESSQNETEASVSYFTFTLPPEYVAAGDVKVRVNSKVAGTGTLGTCTVDIEAYEQADGAVGSDICATAAQDIDGTYANDDFVITATGLVAGDTLTIKLTTSVEETGNANPLEANIDKVALLLDVKG